MKKLALVIIFIFSIIFYLRLLTPEDAWIKNKTGEWVRHGHPRSPKPTSHSTPSFLPSPSKPRANREELGGYCGVSSFGLCHYDTDCYISGCNAEICQSKGEPPIMSACVILDCHKKPEGLSCGCKKGECQWQLK